MASLNRTQASEGGKRNGLKWKNKNVSKISIARADLSGIDNEKQNDQIKTKVYHVLYVLNL